MKITDVTTAVVEANFDYVFVRVHTDEGVHGTGECFFAPGITAVVRDFGRVLVGTDPTSVNAALARLIALASCFGGPRGAGMAYNAVSGIDAALWDLNGKLLGQPLVRLLGGAVRDEVDVYLDLHAGAGLASLDRSMRYRTPAWASRSGRTEVGAFYFEAEDDGARGVDAMVERGREALAAGFRTVKFDLDVFAEERVAGDRALSRADVDRIRDQAAALRDGLGDAAEIAFDCHWRFDVPSALRVAEAVAPMSPAWLEDPTPPDPASLAAVGRHGAVPVATGENTYLLEGFIDLIDAGAASILQPDVQKVGGITEAVRVVTLAAKRFLPVAPHCIASPLGFLAAAHVCAAATNVACLEFHGSDVPFWGELVDAPEPIIRDGKIRLPTRPGVGVELNEDVVRAHALPGEPVFEEGPRS
ncbi:MAG TPA: mandelate racemase/muconate lactonizing enzyme family protein [Acidimicrobiales bacterium]